MNETCGALMDWFVAINIYRPIGGYKGIKNNRDQEFSFDVGLIATLCLYNMCPCSTGNNSSIFRDKAYNRKLIDLNYTTPDNDLCFKKKLDSISSLYQYASKRLDATNVKNMNLLDDEVHFPST